jgi:hypothetical protein
MQIKITRKIPFNLSIVFNTDDLVAHSAYGDLTLDERNMIHRDFNLLLDMIESMMTRRRVELNKDRG